MAFDAAQLLTTLSALQGPDARTLPSALYGSTWRQLRALFPLLGPALHLASWDVNMKLDALDTHLRNIARAGVPPMHSDTGYSLRALMAFEIKRGGAHAPAVNGVHSLCRTVQRLMWMLQFARNLCSRLAEDESESLRAAASAAYDDVLYPHHGWVKVQAIRAALLIVPSRASFYTHVSPEHVRAIAALLHAPTRCLEEFFEQFLPDDIP